MARSRIMAVSLAGAALAVTLLVSAIPADASVITINGAWTPADPTLNPRVFRNGVSSSCGSAKAFPGTFSGGPFPYDVYTFFNGGPAECVTVVQTATVGTSLHVSAYGAGGFDATNVSGNYLGDSGFGGTVVTFGVDIPAHSLFELVAISSTPEFGNYTFTVSGDSVSSVPEPTTLLLLGGGLVGLRLRRRS